MFFYSTSKKFTFPLTIMNLSDQPILLDQAAEWAERDVGYLRGFPGVVERKKILTAIMDSFYMICYGQQPIVCLHSLSVYRHPIH